MSMYSTGKAARKLGVSIRTLQQWDRDGKFVAQRSPKDRRYYTEEQLRQYRQEVLPVAERKVLAYVRVSSRAQQADLVNQKAKLEEFCIAKGIAVSEWIEEIGGGLNFRRPRFLGLFDLVLAGEIEGIVIAHQDRLARFGFEFLQYLCETRRCTLTVMNTES